MKKKKVALILLAAFVLYLVIGAIIPFVHTKSVGEEYAALAENMDFVRFLLLKSTASGLQDRIW